VNKISPRLSNDESNNSNSGKLSGSDAAVAYLAKSDNQQKEVPFLKKVKKFVGMSSSSESDKQAKL
jgi:hypothetical protein